MLWCKHAWSRLELVRHVINLDEWSWSLEREVSQESSDGLNDERLSWVSIS
jgi:hypothetical protein